MAKKTRRNDETIEDDDVDGAALLDGLALVDGDPMTTTVNRECDEYDECDECGEYEDDEYEDDEYDDDDDDFVTATSTTMTLNLLDAMTALELGDVRMDCCEVPYHDDDIRDHRAHATGDAAAKIDEVSTTVDATTMTAGGVGERIHRRPTGAHYFPPRIAPTRLKDGTPRPSSTYSHSRSSSLAEAEASVTTKITTTTIPNDSSSFGCHDGEDPSSSPSPPPPRSTPPPLHVPESPCPSLQPYWNELIPDAYTLLPILLLQLTALESYVGTENGGCTAAETLYCVTWLHDGVLLDMARDVVGAHRDAMAKCDNDDGYYDDGDDDDLDLVGDVSGGWAMDGSGDDDGGARKEDNDGRGRGRMGASDVARWILYASSLGTVRIAELMRTIIVNADFYEEEDFGTTLHGRKATATANANNATSTTIAPDEIRDHGGFDGGGHIDIVGASIASDDGRGCDSIPGGGGARNDICDPTSSSTSVRFCPALRGSRRCEDAWDAALSVLRRYRASQTTAAKEGGGKDDGDDKNNDDDDDDDVATTRIETRTIDAFESIIRLQQSFYRALQILSNLNEDTVCDSTRIAIERSRETVRLLNELRANDAVAESSRYVLVGQDGQLHHRSDRPDLNLLLVASFDPFINRRLLGNVPVRKACFRCPSGAMSSLARIASELEWGVCDLILYGNTLGRITTMLENNSLRSCGGVAPSPLPTKDPSSDGGEVREEIPIGMNVLCRSLLVLNLYFDDKLFGQYDFTDIVGKSCLLRLCMSWSMECHAHSPVPSFCL